MAPLLAEALDPADQVAGRNVALQCVDVHPQGAGELGRAEGDMVAECRLECFGVGLWQGKCAGVHGVSCMSQARFSSYSTRPSAARPSITVGPMRRVPQRQAPVDDRSAGA